MGNGQLPLLGHVEGPLPMSEGSDEAVGDELNEGLRGKHERHYFALFH